MLTGELLEQFHKNNIRYCHWKSNEHVKEGILGITDLDILADKNQQAEVAAILSESGFKKFNPCYSMNYPGIEDYLGYDTEKGVLIHVHLHYRLTIGKKHLKGYHVPWEEMLLERRVWDDENGIYICDSDLELLLLIVRLALKIRHRDYIFKVLGRNYIKKDVRKEFDWLLNRINTEKSVALGRTLVDGESSVILRDLINNGLSLGKIAKFKKKAGNLRDYRRYNGVEAMILRWMREFIWIAGGINKRFINAGYPMRRTIPSRGIMVALLGADGTGKSTITGKLLPFFNAKIDTLPIYFGSGDGPSSFLRKPFKVAYDLFTGNSTGKKIKEAGKEKKDRKSSAIYTSAKTVWAVVLSLEKRKKLKTARRARNLGMLVITDRYPQKQVQGFNDGPLLGDWTEHHNVILKLLARWEMVPYMQAELDPPDLIIKLLVDSDVACIRKPEMVPEEIKRRIDAVRSISFGDNAKIIHIDTGRPLEETLKEVKKAIWEEIC